MKQERTYAKISVTRKAENSVQTGHPWIYDTELVKTDGSYQNGDLVDVFSPRGKYLGTGFINDHSKI
jgi:23S rRNA (cytosine1962-C5)-methyltransferase